MFGKLFKYKKSLDVLWKLCKYKKIYSVRLKKTMENNLNFTVANYVNIKIIRCSFENYVNKTNHFSVLLKTQLYCCITWSKACAVVFVVLGENFIHIYINMHISHVH